MDTSMRLPFTLTTKSDNEFWWLGDRSDCSVREFPVALEDNTVANFKCTHISIAEQNDPSSATRRTGRND